MTTLLIQASRVIGFFGIQDLYPNLSWSASDGASSIIMAWSPEARPKVGADSVITVIDSR